MPIYIYRCDECGIQFEKQQPFNDTPLTRCPECNKKSLHKVYHPVGIVFKGSGFYSTDHRSPSGMGRNSSHETKDSSDSNSDASTSSEKSANTSAEKTKKD